MTATWTPRRPGGLRSPPTPRLCDARADEGAEGFTLLDALAALAILSLIMTVVPRGLAGVRHMQERSTDWLEARLVAQAVLGRELAGRGLRPGIYKGEMAGRKWQVVLRPNPGFPVARKSGDDRRHALLDAHLQVAMSGRPLELSTVVIGTMP